MPRIRTVKPEFWSHVVMGRLDDASKNLALALLNFADDSGYFQADPILVRNFCRPFDDDSTSTRRGLATLVESGWIELVETKAHGTIGRIVNFKDHQRIDRPTPSRIERYFNSTSPRRVLDESSSPEGKGSGNRKNSADGVGKPSVDNFSEPKSQPPGLNLDDSATFQPPPGTNLSESQFAELEIEAGGRSNALEVARFYADVIRPGYSLHFDSDFAGIRKFALEIYRRKRGLNTDQKIRASKLSSSETPTFTEAEEELRKKILTELENMPMLRQRRPAGFVPVGSRGTN